MGPGDPPALESRGWCSAADGGVVGEVGTLRSVPQMTHLGLTGGRADAFPGGDSRGEASAPEFSSRCARGSV